MTVMSENRGLLEALIEAFHKDGHAENYAPDYFQRALNLKAPRPDQHSRSWINSCEDCQEDVVISAECAWSDWNDDDNVDFIEWVTQGIYAIDEDASIEITTELRISYTKEGGKEENA
jgi:hypothetical protein